VGVAATSSWHLRHGIPTKPAGGLLSDLGKVAASLGWEAVLYRTALKVFYVPSCPPLSRHRPGIQERLSTHLQSGVRSGMSKLLYHRPAPIGGWKAY